MVGEVEWVRELECAAGGVASSPAGGGEEALEVLPGRDEQCLGVHLWQPAQAERAASVPPCPVLAVAEEVLDPQGASAHRFLVGLRLVVGPHAVEVVGAE